MVAFSLETAMIASFADTTNHAGLSMGVFFSYCFILFYGGGIDVVGYVYCSRHRHSLLPQDIRVLIFPIGEIFPTHIRPQGVAWSMFGTFLSTLVYVEPAPTAMASMKWRYYLIFICLTFVNIIILYFWCPEVRLIQSKKIRCELYSDRLFIDERLVSRGDKSQIWR